LREDSEIGKPPRHKRCGLVSTEHEQLVVTAGPMTQQLRDDQAGIGGLGRGDVDVDAHCRYMAAVPTHTSDAFALRRGRYGHSGPGCVMGVGVIDSQRELKDGYYVKPTVFERHTS
jgi:hypothetical protein